MYLWVHLRAEEGEEDHFVPPSELVLLPAGHPQHLIPNHHPPDENGSGETEGLAQDAVCRKEGTVGPSEWALDHLHPQVQYAEGRTFMEVISLKKEPGKGQMFILPVAVPKCCISYSRFTPQRTQVNSRQGLLTKNWGAT